MSQNTLKVSLPIAVIVLTLLAVPAGASPVLYTTNIGWTAAVTNVITAPFTDQAGLTAYTRYNTALGLTVGDVNFVGFTGAPGEFNLTVYNPAYDASLNRGSGASLAGGYSPGYLLATLPGAGVYALAVEISSETQGRDVVITLSTGAHYTITTPANSTMMFWGITSDVAITNIRFCASGTFTMIDNFSYSIPGEEEIPEPISLVLGATGLAAILLARRLRRFC